MWIFMIFSGIPFIKNETSVVLLLSMLKDYFKREYILFLGLLWQKRAQTGCLWTIGIYRLTVWRLESVLKGSATVPPGVCQGELFPDPWLASGGFAGHLWHSLFWSLCLPSCSNLPVWRSVFKFSFFKATSHSGLRTHLTPIWPHVNLTNYIYNSCILKEDHVLRHRGPGLSYVLNYIIHLKTFCVFKSEHPVLQNVTEKHPVPQNVNVISGFGDRVFQAVIELKWGH